MAVLEKGGNAFDAAVAAGFVLQVVEPHLNGPGGEVPVIGYDARRGETFVVCGQGTAPAAATVEAPTGTSASTWCRAAGCSPPCVPGAFGGWLLLLREYGTLRLRDVLGYAIGYAESGYPLVPSDQLVDRQRGRPVPRALDQLRAEVYLPGGGVPAPGSRFANPALAATYKRVLAEAEAAGDDRDAQLEAARRAWYERVRRRGDRQVRGHRGDGRHRGAAPRPAHRARPVDLARPPGSAGHLRLPGPDRVQDRPVGPGTGVPAAARAARAATTWRPWSPAAPSTSTP